MPTLPRHPRHRPGSRVPPLAASFRRRIRAQLPRARITASLRWVEHRPSRHVRRGSRACTRPLSTKTPGRRHGGACGRRRRRKRRRRRRRWQERRSRRDRLGQQHDGGSDCPRHHGHDVAYPVVRAVTASGIGGIDFSQNALQLQMAVDEAGQQIPITALYIGGSVYEKSRDWTSWFRANRGSRSTSARRRRRARDQVRWETATTRRPCSRLLALQGNTVVALGSSNDRRHLGGGLFGQAQCSHHRCPAGSRQPSALDGVGVEQDQHPQRHEQRVRRRLRIAPTLQRGYDRDRGVEGERRSRREPRLLRLWDAGQRQRTSSSQVVSFQQFLQAAEAAAGNAPS